MSNRRPDLERFLNPHMPSGHQFAAPQAIQVPAIMLDGFKFALYPPESLMLVSWAFLARHGSEPHAELCRQANLTVKDVNGVVYWPMIEIPPTDDQEQE